MISMLPEADRQRGTATRTPDSAVVRVDRISKAFPVRRGWRETARHPFRKAGRVTVVNDVSFDVGPAEFFGLLGANGAGKTTLFKMLAAQLLPDSGGATIAGHDVVRNPDEVRRLLTPVIADERSLNWRLSARENLELFAALYRIERKDVSRRVSELLETVELHDAGTKMVGTFSSGMKQRLLIARALLPHPRVLLLDEPTRSLDPVSARRFRKFLQEEISGRQKCTVLLATHSAEEAFELCDRVAVLDRGKLLATGRPAELMGQVRDDAYRLTLRRSHEHAARQLLPENARASTADGSDPDWTVLTLHITGGPDGAAALVSRLAAAGIAVSGLEHQSLTLADLLERIVSRRLA